MVHRSKFMKGFAGISGGLCEWGMLGYDLPCFPRLQSKSCTDVNLDHSHAEGPKHVKVAA